MTNWLDRFIARNEWLGFARKRPIPHESYFMVAGYFFYYGHYYAEQCTEKPWQMHDPPMLDVPLGRPALFHFI